LKDQHLKKRLFVSLASVGLFVTLSAARAATLTEDFSANPLQVGWQIFGDTNLFVWNETNRDLEVTWDSTQPNTYFYRPLGVTLTRYDDFTLEFDLRLSDIASGVEPGKTGPLQISLGLLNLAEATSTNFMRGAYGGAPNVAEFDYYTDGFYDYGGLIYPSPASTVSSFIPGTDSYHYAPAFVSVFETELPTDQTVHIRLAYTGADQTALLSVTTNGVLISQLPPLVLSDAGNSQFTPTDNFHVDTFSISSYSSNGDDFDSVLAHGTVDNLVVQASLVRVSRIAGAFTAEGGWRAQFFAHTNWLYTLERTSDFKSWTAVSTTLRGTEDLMTLQDTNSLPARAFYRVRAD
jgi:hypothetical protein